MPENTDAEPRLGDVEQLADQLLDRADADQAQLLGPDGLLAQLTQRVLNRPLDVELASPGRRTTRNWYRSIRVC